MINYISRSKAINKLKMSNLMFDWLCYLNNISGYVPRIQKKKNILFILRKDFKKIKTDNIFFKIKQIEIWKNLLKTFRNKNKIKKSSLILKNIPSYNFEAKIKEKFLLFNDTLQKFKNLFSFIIVIIFKTSNNINYLELDENIKSIKIFFFFLLTLVENYNKVLYLKNSIHLQFRILNQDINIILPKKKIILSGVKFNEFLKEKYISISNFILKKIISFYGFKYINCNYNNILEKFDLSLSFSKKNYTGKKKNQKKYFSKKYKNILQSYELLTFINYDLSKICWTFSKNIKLPEFFSSIANLVFYIEFEKKNDINTLFYKFIVKKYLSFKNHIRITHIICKKIASKIYSLLSHLITLIWITNVINCNSNLPVFLNYIHNTKRPIINPFYWKNDSFYFRYILGKEKLNIEEYFDKNKITWFYITSKYITYQKKKITITKISSIFL